MATYLILNLMFLAAVLLTLRVLHILQWNKSMTYTLIVLIVMTTIFDSLIVGAEIVAYDPTRILGVMIGKAPIEDFFYALLAVILVPNVWHALKKGGDDA